MSVSEYLPGVFSEGPELMAGLYHSLQLKELGLFRLSRSGSHHRAAGTVGGYMGRWGMGGEGHNHGDM